MYRCICVLLAALTSQLVIGQNDNRFAYQQSGFDATNLVESRIPYEFDGEKFEGYFVYDSSCTAPLTPVLINHNWDGVDGYEEWRAKLIANECYAAFVVSVYNSSTGTGEALPFPQRMALVMQLAADQTRTHGILSAAVDAIKAQEVVSGDGVIAIGYCSGGYIAMEYVRAGLPMLGAIALHVGNPTVSGPMNFTNAVDGARVVILNGADDGSVAEGAYDKWMEEATEASLIWEYTLYGNTVHSFTEPSNSVEFVDPSGNSVYNPYADERSFSQSLDLFKDFVDSNRNDYVGEPWNETGVVMENLMSIEVDYTDPYDGASLKGIAVYDTTFCGPRPVVLIVCDWDGIGDYEVWRARLLAHQGYFAFVVDVYSTAVPQPVEDFDTRIQQTGFYLGEPARIRARLQAGLTEVYSTKHAALVLPNSAVIIGYCFGGSSILEFARDDPEGLVAAVSFHAGALTTTGSKMQPGNDVKVLVLNGGDDRSVPADEIGLFLQEFGEADIDFEFTNFAYTPHGWTAPSSSAYTPISDWRSWSSFLAFLDTVLDGQLAPKC